MVQKFSNENFAHEQINGKPKRKVKIMLILRLSDLLIRSILNREEKRNIKMENEVIIFGHKNPDTDSICSSIIMEDFEKKMGNKNAKAVRIGNINKETRYVLDYLSIKDIPYIEDVEDNQEVILVDHNEATQCVSNIENAKILKVIDHHTMNFKAPYQLYYRTEPVGCTATVLYKLYQENNIKMERNIAILCLSCIISDTLLLKSPTTTEQEKKLLEELAEIAEIDVNEYGLEMLKAGTDLGDFSAKELINIDAKVFEKEGIKFEIAQVNTVSIEDVLQREEELKAVIQQTIKEKGLSLFVLAITDIFNSNSEIIALGEKAGVIKLAFGKELVKDRAFLEGVTSRKKQLLPNIDNNI